MLCVRAISSGKAMTFTLLDYQTEPPVKLRLRLPNDQGFRQHYKQLYDTLPKGR
jgi:hypothetical protein